MKIFFPEKELEIILKLLEKPNQSSIQGGVRNFIFPWKSSQFYNNAESLIPFAVNFRSLNL